MTLTFLLSLHETGPQVITADLKTEDAALAYDETNLVCRAVKAVKSAHPGIGIICDVALDPFTSHGQDGLLVDNEIVNDETVDVLCKQVPPPPHTHTHTLCHRRPRGGGAQMPRRSTHCFIVSTT